MRFSILLFFICSSLFAQTTIPLPSNLLASLGNAIIADSTKLVAGGATQISYTRPSASDISNLYPSLTQNIGDFDGDKSDDIYIIWSIAIPYSVVNNIGGASWHFDFNFFGIYSLKKGSYILQDVGNAAKVETGDFNGDSLVEFIVGKKIYQSSTVLAKKKPYNPEGD
jgi:hypothetical protein